jgi:hypothetical protein
MFFWLKSRANWLLEANISEKHAVFVFRVEDEALMMETACLFEILTSSNQSTRRLNPKEHHYYRRVYLMYSARLSVPQSSERSRCLSFAWSFLTFLSVLKQFPSRNDYRLLHSYCDHKVITCVIYKFQLCLLLRLLVHFIIPRDYRVIYLNCSPIRNTHYDIKMKSEAGPSQPPPHIRVKITVVARRLLAVSCKCIVFTSETWVHSRTLLYAEIVCCCLRSI